MENQNLAPPPVIIFFFAKKKKVFFQVKTFQSDSPTPHANEIKNKSKKMSTTDHVVKKRRVEVAAVEEPPKHFCCAVCMHAPDCNVFQCRNGHILCDGCLQKITDGRGNTTRAKCPTCREHGDFFRNLAVENAIADMPAVCQYCVEGTTRGTLASHALRCPSAPDVTCSRHLEGCEWTGRESARAEHETNCAIVRLCAQHDAAHAHDRSSDSTRRRRLYLAADAGHESVVGMFLRRDSRLLVEEGGRMLFNAAHRNQEALVNMLLHHKANVNEVMNGGATPLYVAAQNGHAAVVRALIEAEADLNKAKLDGATPLYIAAYKGHEAVVRALVEAKADLNTAVKPDDATPLASAAHRGHEMVVRALVNAKADPNKAMGRGITPLHIAAQLGHETMARVLVEAGADPDKVMNDGTTARSIAERKGLDAVLAIIEKAPNIL